VGGIVEGVADEDLASLGIDEDGAGLLVEAGARAALDAVRLEAGNGDRGQRRHENARPGVVGIPLLEEAADPLAQTGLLSDRGSGGAERQKNQGDTQGLTHSGNVNTRPPGTRLGVRS
jgi:hypothetical protein